MMTKIDVLKLNDNKVDQIVKIQGTDYDRKRRVTSKILTKMRKLAQQNKTYAEIATQLGFSSRTVRYNLDEEWRKMYNLTRSGAHTGKDKITKSNRISYKRELVASGKVSV